MKKTHTRITALFGALAMATWGIGMTGCFTSASGDSGSGGISANRESVSAPATPGTVTISGETTWSGTSIVEAFAKIANISSGDITITLAPGTYEVPAGLNYKGGANITIMGTGTAQYGLDVLIKGRGKDQLTNKTRPVLEVEGSGNLVIANVAIQNITKRSEVTETSASGGALTQAEALGFDSSGTVAAYNSSFLSHQDTVRTVSKSWFYKCYIEGDVDFIWMEAGSIVGLYEQCKIYIAGDDGKSECYILAPRIDLTSKVGKGNVIYKSHIIVGDGVTKAYLFRNPWSKNPNTLYNQGAVVDTEISGTLHSDLAKYDAWGHDDHDPQHLGWKVDSAIARAYSSKLSSIGTLDATTKANEYGGREAILNRMYNLSEKSYAQDNSNYWDIAAVISKNGWSTTVDTSSSKQDGDSTKTSVTYNMSTDPKTDGMVDYNGGFSHRPNNAPPDLWAKSSGATLSFWVVGDCTVTVAWNYQGYIQFSTGETFGSAATGNSGSGSVTLTGITSAKKITITTLGQTYLTNLDIQYTSNVDAALEALKAKLAANTTYDFKQATTGNQGDTISGSKIDATSGGGGAITNINNFNWHDSNYGLNVNGSNDNTMQIPVTGACKIYVNVSYVDSAASGSSITINSTEKTYTASINNNETAPNSWSISSAGNVTLTAKRVGGTFCIGSISVIYVE